MPATLGATHAHATIGEITEVLREIFGEFREPVTL
jgi:methylmalonyl-CoA mutase N-terminal domain/subunit